MSKSEVLYVRGINTSETEEEEEDIWDDKKLNDAYDKALRMANAEVAKRVAMSTNTDHSKKANLKGKSSKSSRPSSSKKKDIQWKAGMPCRAVYEGDGLEYEAFVLRVINDTECVVRFLGYENSEIVSLSSLKASHGNEERTRQIEEALHDNGDDGFGSQSPVDRMEFGSDRAQSPESTDRSGPRKTTKKKKNVKKSRNIGFELPEIPVPNMATLRNLGSIDMPIPPPPPMNFASDSDSEQQAISSMLLSWYMSGYYTGLYQGMKRSKENKNM